VSEQPGRYQRSFSGMVGALLVLVLVIGAFLVFRSLSREDLEVEPERVDYREAVGFAQQAGWEVVYPDTVPDSWRATSVDSTPGQVWGIGFLTPDGFAGIAQRDESAKDLLETYVDEDPSERAPVEVKGSVAGSWQVYEDAGGDRAYLAELGEDRVLVYGSAPAADLERLVGSLTTRPLAG
jgi:hypothetical protein